MNIRRKLAVVIVALGSVSVAQADPILLFDDGAPLAMDTVLRRNGMSGGASFLTIYDDFSLEADATVSDLLWYQLNHRRVEEFGLYQDTTISIWAGQPVIGELLIEFAVEALFQRDTTFRYGDSPSDGEYYGYKFSISGLELSLAAGSYWLGIHNNDSGANESNWAMTSSRDDDLSGRWQVVESYCGYDWWLCDQRLNFIESEDSAFSISGWYVSVPEPSTLALFGIGLAGMGLARRRKR